MFYILYSIFYILYSVFYILDAIFFRHETESGAHCANTVRHELKKI